MTEQKKQKPKQELHEVQLLKDHKHAGKKEPAGKKIKVNAIDKAWLAAQKIIAPDEPTTAPAAAAAPATAKKG
ncbi:hypothetical protein [uncultured Halopseudomonas sp.]|uniref:DUF7210 family protein n=1 Tax=uncultured Halopseudomonas sp. TaxID=2901193 RepID=UPI0030EF1739|tara:strand:- start:28544 stop:28762 length:219 start_codon:yes stop_codon:yes gene_type:complete